MKFLYAFIFSTMLIGGLQAQDFQDAWRYGNNQVNGSARFMGMSGAFSSLGGDMSAVNLNPAGATTFTTNRLSGTFSLFNTRSTANYFNNSHTSDYLSFDDRLLNVDQLGGVFVYQSDVDDWNKLAIGFNINKEADYYNRADIVGINTTGNSVANFFVNQANGFALDDLRVHNNETVDDAYQWLGENIGYDAQQGFLAYQSYLANPVDPADANNTAYNSAATYTSVAHRNTLYTEGKKSNFDISIAGTYQKKLQLGFALSFKNIDYVEGNSIIENGYAATSDLQELKLKNTLRVEGSGVGLKFGAIYKPVKSLRLSIAYHSPEWLNIEENMKQSLQTSFANGDQVEVSPNIENSFAPYKIITPSKTILGASIVVKKNALLSVDYSYQNFANIRFREKDADADMTYFDNINDGIHNNMQAVHRLNMGGELRLKKLSLRAGTYMASSPLKSNNDLFTEKGYSAGLGITFETFTLDFAYMNSQYTNQQNVLNVPDTAKLTLQKNKFMCGIRYNF